MLARPAIVMASLAFVSFLHAQANIPEEARRAFVQGTTLAKEAKTPQGQLLAVESFQKAVDLAPNWRDALYNLAVAQELAGKFDDAQATLKRYIKTKPGENETRKAQDKIYALEAKAKLAAVSGAESQAKKAEDDKNALAASLDGARFVYEMFDYGGTLISRFAIEVRGNTVYAIDTPITGSRDAGRTFTMTGPLNGLTATVCCGEPGTIGGDPASRFVVDISPDGQSATRKFFMPDGRNVETFTYKRR